MDIRTNVSHWHAAAALALFACLLIAGTWSRRRSRLRLGQNDLRRAELSPSAALDASLQPGSSLRIALAEDDPSYAPPDAVTMLLSVEDLVPAHLFDEAMAADETLVGADDAAPLPEAPTRVVDLQKAAAEDFDHARTTLHDVKKLQGLLSELPARGNRVFGGDVHERVKEG